MLLQPQKPGMSFNTFYFRWILIFGLCVEGISMHMTHLRKFNFSAGFAFQLQCNGNHQTPNVSVSWSQRTNRSLENVRGIKVKQSTLWFLPAELSHSGNYSCFSRDGNDTWETIFMVSVENGTCPHWNRVDYTKSTDKLCCFLENIFEFDPQSQYHITWFKDCSPLNVTNSTYVQINRSSEMAGLYTCFVTFTFEGQKYTSAQTTQIENHSDDGLTPPTIIYPKNETRSVRLGDSFKFTCKAHIGKNDINEMMFLWWNSESIVLNYSNVTMEDDMLVCTLNIPEVTEEYLNTNLWCYVKHSAGQDYGILRLTQANQSELYCWIGVGVITVLILLAAVLFYLFKVDLVLTYRNLCLPLSVQNDGKCYDAYVSYLHGDQLSLSSTMTFALRFLPAVLEDLHDYKLFISGRDDLPGEAVPDTIADRMNRCRRLIIVLTSQSFAKPQTDTKNSLLSDCELAVMPTEPVELWGTYEQRVGLYDALVKEGLKVILVQVDDGVEESLLPESLQYISRTKGILKWRTNSSERANRKFWKYLRYRMPPARLQKSKDALRTVYS